MSESATQALVRLSYTGTGGRLWRNNTGVLTDPGGRPVRFGLANDSPALNAQIKSSDLIGWRCVTITPDMVGQRIAQFASIECKAPGWRLTPGDARGHAQKRWLDLVRDSGGHGLFVTGVVDGFVVPAYEPSGDDKKVPHG